MPRNGQDVQSPPQTKWPTSMTMSKDSCWRSIICDWCYSYYYVFRNI